jgi:hypothetical protein
LPGYHLAKNPPKGKRKAMEISDRLVIADIPSQYELKA